MKSITNYFKWVRITTLLILFSSLFILNSCYDDYGLATEDYDVVVTNYDTNRKELFPQNKTYFLVDSVFHLIGEDEKDDISRAYDETIISQIRQNMADFGYTEISNPSENNLPDVIVRTAVTTSEHYGTVWNPWYPGWGWGGGYWGGWYYPWYPGGSVSYYSYETGTLFVDLTDTEDWDPYEDSEQDVEVLWQGIMNGLLKKSSTGTAGRITQSIDQMFNQSQYLNVK